MFSIFVSIAKIVESAYSSVKLLIKGVHAVHRDHPCYISSLLSLHFCAISLRNSVR